MTTGWIGEDPAGRHFTIQAQRAAASEVLDEQANGFREYPRVEGYADCEQVDLDIKRATAGSNELDF